MSKSNYRWIWVIQSKSKFNLEALTSKAGYSQLIDTPTHFFNGGSSCIDLIFCNKPEFVIEYGIDHSLFHTCHHNIIFAKISAKIALPPDYEWEVWDHKKANIDSIQKSISFFNWKREAIEAIVPTVKRSYGRLLEKIIPLYKQIVKYWLHKVKWTNLMLQTLICWSVIYYNLVCKL